MRKSQTEKQTGVYFRHKDFLAKEHIGHLQRNRQTSTKKDCIQLDAVFFLVSCANDYRRKPNLATIAR